MLLGEYHHNMDEKHRLVIPTKYREQLGNTFVITRGIEKCLTVYSMSEWEKLVEKLDSLSFTKKDSRTFTRFFFSGAVECEFDSSGRIIIQDSLVNYASLHHECVVIGVNDHLEIWDSDKFNEFMDNSTPLIDQVSENLFEASNAL